MLASRPGLRVSHRRGANRISSRGSKPCNYVEFKQYGGASTAIRFASLHITPRCTESNVCAAPHTFDWNFNPPTFSRSQIEELATWDFIRRRTNLVMVGWTRAAGL